MDDHAHTSKVGNALPATLAAITATTSGTIIDTAGFEGLEFVISTGTFATFDGTNKWTFSVEESNDSTMVAGTTALATLDYMRSQLSSGADWDRVCDGGGDDEAVFRIVVKIPTAARKRYMRLVLTEGGTVSAAAAATYTLYHYRHAPI